MKNQKHTVRKVIDYIEEHLEEKLNLEQIAEHAGYSRFHLNRIFMEETRFINMCRSAGLPWRLRSWWIRIWTSRR